MSIDNSISNKIVARKGNAIATYFKASKRIVCVADQGCIHHLQSALVELEKVIPNEQPS